MRCLDLIGRLGPMTAVTLAEQSRLTTGAVTFILDRLEESGMVTCPRDPDPRRRVRVEIVRAARQQLQCLQQPWSRRCARGGAALQADEPAIVRDFMRQVGEVSLYQVSPSRGEQRRPRLTGPAAPPALPAPAGRRSRQRSRPAGPSQVGEGVTANYRIRYGVRPPGQGGLMPYVFDFDHAHARPPMELKDLLGGKGANLAEMTSVLELPVPPGFTISTDACRDYMAGAGRGPLRRGVGGQGPARDGHGQGHR